MREATIRVPLRVSLDREPPLGSGPSQRGSPLSGRRPEQGRPIVDAQETLAERASEPERGLRHYYLITSLPNPVTFSVLCGPPGKVQGYTPLTRAPLFLTVYISDFSFKIECEK